MVLDRDGVIGMSALTMHPGIGADAAGTPTVAHAPERAAARARVEVFHDWPAAEVLAAWDALALRVGAEISSCPAYARIWWKHYGRGRLRIVCVWRDEVEPGGASGASGALLVGVLPMFVDRMWVGPIWVRVARLLGCDSTIAVLSPAVEGEAAAEVYRLAAERLIEDERCEVVHFGAVQGDGAAGEAMRAGLSDAANEFDLIERSHGVCTRWDLPGTLEEYAASLEKVVRSNLKRNLNKIGRAPGSRVRVVKEAAEVVEAFDRFMPMHAAQWEAEGQPGHFGDWPGAEAFSREMVAELSSAKHGGRVALIEHDIDGKCVCAYWCYVLGNRAFWRLPARLVGEEWNQYALGRVGLVTMLREMMNLGVRSVDGGPGHYDYKVKHGATEHPLVSFMAVHKTTAARMKAGLLGRYADLVNLVYYRAWRLKTSARLGVRPGALWRWWIRTRV